MKIGVFSILFNDVSLESMLDYVAGAGFDAVEIGTGGYSLSSHCDIDTLLRSKTEARRYLEKFTSRGLFISALGTQGNPVHPDKEYAAVHHSQFEKTVQLAETLGVSRVLLTSGCPGGAPGDSTPNWVICAWPEDYLRAHKYQWEECLIPYWQKAAAYAREHGVEKLAVEPHPGMSVYNTATMKRLIEAVGPVMGCNFDPSHFFWQGMDPVCAIKALGRSIFHVHAKDSEVNRRNVEENGLLHLLPYSEFNDRPWNFRTVGYGHGEETWRRIVSALASVGYDYVISCEHEDCLMTREEGLGKAYDFLNSIIIRDKVSTMWWEMRPEG